VSKPRRETTLSAFDLACRWLARAPRSRAEVAAHLAGIGFSARAVQTAIERLVELGFVDDERLAKNRAETLASRGYGDLWIERDLVQRGLAQDVVTRALAAVPAEKGRARAWLARGARRRGVVPGAWSALARRGFAEETVEDLLGSWDDDGGRGELE
jgi:regulatory protein